MSGWWFELSATGHHRSGVDGTTVNRLAALVRFPYIAAMSRAPLAILFDLDGTLADSVELILGAFRHTFNSHLGFVPADHVWIAGMGTPLSSQIRGLVTDDELVEPMIATYREWQNQHHDALLREFEGVRETLSILHDRGHEMALVTSKATEAAKRALRLIGIDALLSQVVGLDSTTSHKPNPEPVLNNTCYSFVTDREAVHVASVHRYDAAQKTFLTVPGSGGLSAAKSELEGEYGFAWARAIWKDMLG